MKRIIFITFMLTMMIIACATQQTQTLTTPPVKDSITAPEKTAPTAHYYSTYNNLTEQEYPEKDWPYVTYVNELEPKTITVNSVWINYDENALMIEVFDSDKNEHRCVAFIFMDVSICSTEQWPEAYILTYAPVDCGGMDTMLNEELKRGRI